MHKHKILLILHLIGSLPKIPLTENNDISGSEDHISTPGGVSRHYGPLLRRSSSLLENLRHHSRDPREQTNCPTRFFLFSIYLHKPLHVQISESMWSLRSQGYRRLFTKRRNRSVGFTTSPILEFVKIGKRLIAGYSSKVTIII